MTKQEFMRQIWRPYDTVELEGGAVGKVTTVCFPTRSVKVTISDNVHEWIECELIVSHTSVVGNPDDLAIIEDLHEKLVKAEEKNEQMQVLVKNKVTEVNCLKESLNRNPPKDILKAINGLKGALIERKTTVAALENALRRINLILDQYHITNN
jgi:hypothetical protein